MSWLILIPLFLLLPFLGSFLFIPGSNYSDLLISHYPNALFLHESLFQDGVVPLWSGRILSGFPYAANPLSGLWYPFGWLPVIFPSAWAYNLTFGLHLVFGGAGMYRWLRSEGAGRQAAITGALAFELLPKIWAHNSAGHISLVFAVTWTPWLLLAARNALKRFPGWSAWPGVVLSIIILADVRWAVLAGILWVGYFLFKSWRTARKAEVSIGKNDHNSKRKQQGWLLRPFLHLGAQGVVGVLASACLLLPLMEFARLSTRSQISTAEALTLSLPPTRLLGILFPDWGGGAEWTIYPGQAILMLALLALVTRINRSTRWFWLAGAVVSLVISLGSNLPGWTVLSGLPIPNILRVPPRALFIFNFCLIVLAVYYLDALMDCPPENINRRVGMAAAGLVELTLFIGGAIWFFNKAANLNILWSIVVGVLTWLVIRLKLRSRISPAWFWIGITALVVSDSGLHALNSFQPRAPAEVFHDGYPAVAYISSQNSNNRSYSPSYSIPQQTAAQAHLKLADGVDPLQLSSYVDFMEVATGVSSTGYSVTLPPFATGEPSIDNRDYIPDSIQLGLLNVGWVVSEYEMDAPGLTLAHQIGSTRIYHNDDVRPRAWIENENGTNLSKNRNPSLISENANEIVLQADGPGILVLSEIMYPGWRVEVDGEKADPVTRNELLRSVNLSEGQHSVRWYFTPASIQLGIILSLVIWLSALGYEIFLWRMV